MGLISRCIKTGCHSLVINKKYKLCKVHNWERMNPNKDFFQSAMDKVKISQEKNRIKKSLKNKTSIYFKPKKQKVIKPRSSKRAKQEREYNEKSRPEYLLEHPICECCEKRLSVQIHHKKGRIGDLLNNKKFFLAVCDKCHKKIEMKPEWAKDNGYSISRLT